MSREIKKATRLDLLNLLQTTKDPRQGVIYRGRILNVDRVDDRPPLLYIAVSGWPWALSSNGQDTNHALAAIRDIDQLIDILDNTTPSEKGN